MREILFRGKRIDNGEWAFGFFTESPSGNFYITETVCGCASPKRVDSETVGQYTGLNDKNGKKIFEGDICRVCLDPEICVGKIIWDDKIASYNILFYDGKCVLPLDLWLARNNPVWIEVIGNIHDNPEPERGDRPRITTPCGTCLRR